MNHFKKSNKKLEKLRTVFFQLGIVIACGLSLLAFEWTFSTKIAYLGGTVIDEITEDFDTIEPFEKEEKKEEKIKEETKPNTEEFEKVDDNHKEPEEDPKKEKTKEKKSTKKVKKEVKKNKNQKKIKNFVA